MKIAIWVMVSLITLGAVGGAVYLGVHDFQGGSGKPLHTSSAKNPVASAGKQTFHLDEDGTQREFIVYRPTNLAKTEKVPVVFMFHGSGQSGELFYEKSGWKDKADEEGFMVVYPTGLKYHVYKDEKEKNGQLITDWHGYQTKWNSYSLPGQFDTNYPDQVPADDVQFTRDMVDFLKKNYAVDDKRIYATGFSNGAEFTERLAVEASDIFAAYAPTGAGMIGDQILAGIQSKGVQPAYRPIIQVIGSKDPNAIRASGLPELPTDESDAQDGSYVKDAYVAGNLALEGLSDQYEYEDVHGSAHFTYDHSNVGADNQYQIYIVDNMIHIYPNGTNIGFDVTDYYWPFFAQYSL